MNIGGRYQKLLPAQALYTSYDLGNNKLGGYGNRRSHQRNLSQLPAGGDYPEHQSIIKGLDTATKLDLLKKGSRLQSMTLASVKASQERIRETVRQSVQENPLNPLDRESTFSIGESHGIESQDGIFFQPDHIKGEHRQGRLKIMSGRKSPMNANASAAKSRYTSGAMLVNEDGVALENSLGIRDPDDILLYSPAHQAELSHAALRSSTHLAGMVQN